MAQQISLPKEFEERMRLSLGSQYNDFEESLATKSPVSIRINPHKNAIPANSERIPWAKHGLYLQERPNFTLDPTFHAGAYYVQESSSMLLEQAVQQTISTKPLLVLDLCAAPGGKSTHLLNMLPEGSLLVSNEVIRTRANILAENISKWGHCNTVVTNNDPKDFSKLTGVFDLIIVDVPCSGEGLFRKDPSAMEEWSVANTELCSLRQQRILHDVWPALKAGGMLIYSTCTFNEKENLFNLKQLQNNYQFKTLAIKCRPEWGVETVSENPIHGYQCYPHKVKGEGFFFAILQKNEMHRPSSIRPKKLFTEPSQKITEELQSWIKTGIDFTLVQQNENVSLLPTQWKDEMEFFSHMLRPVSVGTAITTIKHNKLVPAHDLAMSISLNQRAFQKCELNLAEAIKYLRKEQITLASGTLGHSLVTYKNIPLGWVNILSNRANNLYPKEWRIRMNTNIE